MNSVHNKAKAALEQYRKDNVQTTNNLILALKDIVVAYESNATKEEKFLAIDTLLSKHSSEILEKCDKHNANSRSHYSFLWQYYKSNRKILFGMFHDFISDGIHNSDESTHCIYFNRFHFKLRCLG